VIAETDYAWFAGWLCADGCVSWSADKAPRLKFKLTEREPLDRMVDLFGGSVSGPHPPTGWGKKDTFYWAIGGDRAVEVLRQCWPWMTSRYQLKARLVCITT